MLHPDGYETEKTALRVLGQVGDEPGQTRVLKVLMQYAGESSGSHLDVARAALKQLDKRSG